LKKPDSTADTFSEKYESVTGFVTGADLFFIDVASASIMQMIES
jgi:hypothetical protein